MSKFDDFDRLKAMRMGAKFTAPVSINGTVFNFRPLTNYEMTLITSETAAEMMKIPDGQRNRIVENSIFVKKILSKASSELESARLPELSETMLGYFTPDELSYLYDEYSAICARFSPILEQMTDNEFVDLVSELKKKTKAVRELSFKQLVEICQRLIFSKGD